MSGDSQKPDLEAQKKEKIISKFLTKSPDELAADKSVEDNIEELLSYDFSANHDGTLRYKIDSKIREFEKKLGNTVNSHNLFRITLADDSRDFEKEWAKLFNPDDKKEALNTTIAKFILQTNEFLSGKIKEFVGNI